MVLQVELPCHTRRHAAENACVDTRLRGAQSRVHRASTGSEEHVGVVASPGDDDINHHVADGEEARSHAPRIRMP